MIISYFINEISNYGYMYTLLKIEYENYVIKTALRVSSPYNKFILVKLILENVGKLKDKNLSMKCNLLINDCFNF